MKVLVNLDDYERLRDRITGRLIGIYQHAKIAVIDASDDDIEILKSENAVYSIDRTSYSIASIPIPIPQIPRPEVDQIYPDRLFYLVGMDVIVGLLRGYLSLDEIDRPICVIDTGVNPHHLIFRDNFNKVILDSVVDDDGVDDHGHGSHVSGIISVLAPYSTIVSIKMFRRGMQASTESLIASLDKAIQHNCAVVNLSIGGYPPDEEKRIVDLVFERMVENDTIIVSASGNDGKLTQVAYPGESKHVITVGSVNTLLMRSVFSNVDPEGKKPDVTGFGEKVMSADAFSDERLVEMTGTSMATPQVSALSYIMYALWLYARGGRVEVLGKIIDGRVRAVRAVRNVIIEFALQNNPFAPFWNMSYGYGIASLRRLNLFEVWRSKYYRRLRRPAPDRRFKLIIELPLVGTIKEIIEHIYETRVVEKMPERVDTLIARDVIVERLRAKDEVCAKKVTAEEEVVVGERCA